MVSNSFFQKSNTMFQIDRSYIDHISLDSLQGHIWDIRTDYKNDPTKTSKIHGADIAI